MFYITIWLCKRSCARPPKKNKGRKEKIMGKRSARAKKKQKILKKFLAPVLKNVLKTIPREDFLRMLKEKGDVLDLRYKI